MDYTSVGLLIGLFAEGIGVVKELSDLAKRIQRGEKITEEDITLARGKIRDAVSDWDRAGGEDSS